MSAQAGITEDLATELDRRLASADAALAARYPGDRGVRQPVHTVYIPADRYASDTVATWGQQARKALREHAGSAEELAAATGMAVDLVRDVHPRVLAKLADEPIEDLRIDFEDGFGQRPDEEEDDAVATAARALADSVRAGTAAPFHGIRFKSFEAPTRRRGLRTLDLFVGALTAADGLTGGFVVTLPKVTSVDQVEAMVLACERIEQGHGLPPGTLRFEIQVETPQSILGADGTVLVARMIHASAGRCTSLHYGTYDYSASCGIAAAYQSMEHPAADHAKAAMQVAAAGTGVHLSDGSTNVLPVGDRDAVHAAWRLHTRLVRRSLERGYYQGWDLHPAQLPTRYLATCAFYREGLPSAAVRLRAYTGGGDSGYLDEPATAAALAGFLLRGVECAAIEAGELATLTGLGMPRIAQLARRRPPAVTRRKAGSATRGGSVDLTAFNAAAASDLTGPLLACCDVPAWAAAVLAGRPYPDTGSLLAAADEAARRFSREDVDRALAAHPRIGERAQGQGTEAAWSRHEQSAVQRDAATQLAVAEGNRAYEDRFGRVFLICATGLSAEEILTALRARLGNDEETEAGVVADELRKIALLRLSRVVEDSPVRTA